MSRLFGRTSKVASSDADTISHQLLVRSAMVRRLASGLYSYLPLGFRVLKNIEEVIREEMEAAGCQEMLLPIMHPRELWETTGRWESVGPILVRLKDRSAREFCLALTHEEACTQVAAAEIQSYRQLPVRLYHFQTKIRDEPRPRGGLLRVREFIMKDCYSFDADQAGMDESYRCMFEAYLRIFARCGLRVTTVRADGGVMGGRYSHEIMLETEIGEDHLVRCDSCDYAANAEVAKAAAPNPLPGEPNTRPVETIATPGIVTIEALVSILGVLPSSLLKTVVFWVDGRLIAAGVPGDMEVNPTKLQNAIGGAVEIRPATDAEMVSAGMAPGFIGPPLPKGVVTVVDPTVAIGRGFIAGANVPHVHHRRVKRGRDYDADIVADLSTVRGGERCSICRGALRVARGIELGHLFQFGPRPYAEAFRASYLDQHGETKPLFTGSYGIGLGRLMASIVEVHRDERGIMWPSSVAPFQVSLIALNVDRPEVSAAAEQAERALGEAGMSVLYDDRPELAGVKFADSDLIGLPLRVTISPRTLADRQAELKRRSSQESVLVSLDDLVTAVMRQSTRV